MNRMLRIRRRGLGEVAEVAFQSVNQAAVELAFFFFELVKVQIERLAS